MKAIVDYFRAGLLTTWNIVAYMATAGNYLSLEGRVRRGLFRNWIGRYQYRPLHCEYPATVEELAESVRQAKRARLFGAGHSFNDGVVAEETLISLDNLSGVLWRDADKKQMVVKAGMRVREVADALHKVGWAFAALPSHNAQSIGGILSTDVHGTGPIWANIATAGPAPIFSGFTRSALLPLSSLWPIMIRRGSLSTRLRSAYLALRLSRPPRPDYRISFTDLAMPK